MTNEFKWHRLQSLKKLFLRLVMSFIYSTASCPGTDHHWKEPGSNFTPSLHDFIYIDKIAIGLYLHQAEPSHISQLLLIGKVHQSLHFVCGYLLDPLQNLHLSLILSFLKSEIKIKFGKMHSVLNIFLEHYFLIGVIFCIKHL